MTREEAIRRIKAWNLDSDDREVLAVIIPELRESEDERIRRKMIEHFKAKTKEEKQLLLKDLCARLPYGVYVDIYSWQKDSPKLLVECIPEYVGEEIVVKNIVGRHPIKEVKPYLRPMSSMTAEEKDELCKLCDFMKEYDDRDYFSHYGIEIICEYCVNDEKIVDTINYSVIDFFYAHHLDWRGLIPMGLALEAPEGMYKKDIN